MFSRCVTLLLLSVFLAGLFVNIPKAVSTQSLLLFSLAHMFRYYLYLQLLCLWFILCTSILYGDICSLL